MSESVKKHVIITVHGIRTYGGWQGRFERLVSSECPNVQFYHFRYNYFSMLDFWFPPSRWFQVRRFVKELQRTIEKLSPDRLDLVGHSFGTHLIGWGLRTLR